MKEIIKSLTPPILWNKLVYLRSYIHYCKYKGLLSKNLKLRDKYKNKRCFILGSGPSIKKLNLKLLKNEIVFALNNFYVHDDFKIIMSGNAPKYYMTAPVHPPQTETEWLAWFKDMEGFIPTNINMIFGINGYKYNIKYLFDKHKIFDAHSKIWYFAGINYNHKKIIETAMDITRPIYNGESVSIYSLIVAIYMGFEDIYLLGMDHNYFLYENESDMRMYSHAIHQNNELKRTFGNDFYVNEFLRQYNIFSKYKSFSTYSNSNIYNASEGGILHIFPKVKFKSLFKNECVN